MNNFLFTAGIRNAAESITFKNPLYKYALSIEIRGKNLVAFKITSKDYSPIIIAFMHDPECYDIFC